MKKPGLWFLGSDRTFEGKTWPEWAGSLLAKLRQIANNQSHRSRMIFSGESDDDKYTKLFSRKTAPLGTQVQKNEETK